MREFFDLVGLLDDIQRQDVFVGFINIVFQLAGELKESVGIAFQFGLTLLIGLLLHPPLHIGRNSGSTVGLLPLNTGRGSNFRQLRLLLLGRNGLPTEKHY